jgi:hypothetical protein
VIAPVSEELTPVSLGPPNQLTEPLTKVIPCHEVCDPWVSVETPWTERSVALLTPARGTLRPSKSKPR